MKRQGALNVLAISVLFSVTAAQAVAQMGYTRTWDDFSKGFSVNSPSAKWFYFAAGPFVGSDGIATTSNKGLNVRAPGINPITGAPAFTLSVGQEGAPDNPYSLPGGFDHVKWLAYANNLASTGYPGFDALPGQELRFDMWIGGTSYGNEQHPFGSAVVDPNDDIRLANPAMNTIDLATFVVADFFLTNKRIYALYERLPFGRTPDNNYAAFTYAIPVGNRKPGQVHKLSIAYARSTNTMRWLIDDMEVYRVSRLGYRIDPRYMVLDHGGIEEEVECRQRDVGMGTFTLLDAAYPGRPPLVQLSNAGGFYFDTQFGEPTTPGFVDLYSAPSSRLWGEGAELVVKKVVVSSR